MTEIGIWQIRDNTPDKLSKSWLELERHLEDWIENDPDLLQSGLTIVGRQVHTEAGPLDLLALDPQGQWIVIELKVGQVSRDTLSQVLDYASCIASMPFGELHLKVKEYLQGRGESLPAHLQEGILEDSDDEMRDVGMFVVGTGKDPGLERMVAYLAERYDMPINVVTYQVFEARDGSKILTRLLSPPDIEPSPAETRPKVTEEDVLLLADQHGTGSELRRIKAAAESHGLYTRPWKTSLMFTPPQNRTRALFTVWVEPNASGEIKMYLGAAVFPEFLPIPEETAVAILGANVSPTLRADEVDDFIARLDQVFESMETDS